MDIKNTLKKIQENIVSENSVTRYAICQTCENFHSTSKLCMKCGCFMPAKTKLKNVVCPLGKW
jgi:DNA primase large subunit